jgi:hypothetical protein
MKSAVDEVFTPGLRHGDGRVEAGRCISSSSRIRRSRLINAMLASSRSSMASRASRSSTV